MRRIMLCTDLDRTLLPNGSQPESIGSRQRFARLVEKVGLHLVYVSGRHRELVQHAICEYAIPVPDHSVTDVGTRIYRVHSGGWEPFEQWSRKLDNELNGFDLSRLKERLGNLGGLRLQEPGKQNEHKLSFYVADYSRREAMRVLVDRFLENGKAPVRTIWSYDEVGKIGLLDIIPAAATKLHAVRFLMQEECYGEQDVVYAGDSGNDLDVLQSEIKSIVVANAADEIKMEVRKHKRNADRLVIAGGGFKGMNGNYAAGILEGIARFFPELLRYMD
ncbi:HAD-IIB family hydrolase [bacterium]|nr:HAD-IIB family hydrolase [candidate division CSSED10-310 bacterium]